MKLITELNENMKFVTEEGREGQKTMYIVGPFIQTEQKNRNNRMYRCESVSREVKRYVENYVDKNRALGELGHPDGPSINLDRVSHCIVSLKQEGNDFMGKAKLLNTPMGTIARNLIENGVQLGVSTRGMGSIVEENGIHIVQDDFYLATAGDIVADPSAPDAFVNGIMEGVDWIWDNGLIKAQKVEAAKAHINEVAAKVTVTHSKKDLEEAQLRVFQHLISNF
jgi:hypothetical protein